MKRYNMFNNIHKALRALLYEESVALLQCDFTVRAEAERISKRVMEVVDLFENHADTEDNYILPLIMEYEPSVSLAFQEEHIADKELCLKLRFLALQLPDTQEPAEAEQTGRFLQFAFQEFVIFNLKHMAKEEDILNNLLWRYYEDAQLKVFTRNIIAAQSPEKLALASRWMMRGLNNMEIIAWLRQIKGEAPEPVFNGLLNLAEAELSRERWDLVSDMVFSEYIAA